VARTALSLHTISVQTIKKEQHYMRTFKLIGVLAMMLALSAIAVASASASILPGKAGTTLTGTSGKATLQVKGGAAINCQSSTSKGEILSTTESLAIINFGTKCTAAGLAVESAGDASGTILAHVEVTDCAITGGRALSFKLLPLTLEVPSTKLTLLVEGSVLGQVAPVGKKAKSFTLTIAQKEGVQAIEKCEGGSALSLKTSTDGSAFVQSGQEAAEGKVEFGAEEEFMA
jgi:hypothetical protein